MVITSPISTLLDHGIILIVDDVPNNLKVLSSVLADAGFEVAIATSGESALQQLERIPVSLVLLDVMMPGGIDGFETCRRIKANTATRNIPVIFITALSESINKVQGFDLGAVDYITKPFQQGEVLARVRTHLQLNQLSQTLKLKNIELQHLTEKLEQRVLERTQELSAQKDNLEQALQELQQAQIQLVKSEKMSALGNLVAGIAHEMNNPVGFISGNLNELTHTVQDLMDHLHLYRTHASTNDIANHATEIDLDYLLGDLPDMIDSMKVGCDRIKGISTSLRTFSRDDQTYPVKVNIHDGIDSTILILKHRLKANESRPEISIIKNYDNLPSVECYAGQLNQVFMNILANAIDAIDESNQSRTFAEIQAHPNQIVIETKIEDQQVKITIHDNGDGMSAEVKNRIFDYLFTTKGVGKGTGLGLAIAKQIIVEKHGGTINVISQVGQGTTFIVTLPIGNE